MANANGRKPLRVSRTYCHFDTLIWQVPSIGMAAGVGAVVGAAQIKDADGWVLNLAQIRGLILFLGAVLMAALSVALLKYRVFSSASVPHPLPKPPFAVWPSAGTALQLSITTATGIIFGLAAAQVFGAKQLVIIGFVGGVMAAFALELYFNAVRQSMKAANGAG